MSKAKLAKKLQKEKIISNETNDANEVVLNYDKLPFYDRLNTQEIKEVNERVHNFIKLLMDFSEDLNKLEEIENFISKIGHISIDGQEKRDIANSLNNYSKQLSGYTTKERSSNITENISTAMKTIQKSLSFEEEQKNKNNSFMKLMYKIINFFKSKEKIELENINIDEIETKLIQAINSLKEENAAIEVYLTTKIEPSLKGLEKELYFIHVLNNSLEEIYNELQKDEETQTLFEVIHKQFLPSIQKKVLLLNEIYQTNMEYVLFNKTQFERNEHLLHSAKWAKDITAPALRLSLQIKERAKNSTDILEVIKLANESAKKLSEKALTEGQDLTNISIEIDQQLAEHKDLFEKLLGMRITVEQKLQEVKNETSLSKELSKKRKDILEENNNIKTRKPVIK